MSIGQRIWDRRKALRLSQGQLAEMVDADSNTISRWERDVIGIRTKNLIKLAKALDCSVNYLLGGQTESASDNDIGVNEFVPELNYIQTGKSMIIIETGEGDNKRRYILPATPESYDFLKQFHKETESPA